MGGTTRVLALPRRRLVPDQQSGALHDDRAGAAVVLARAGEPRRPGRRPAGDARAGSWSRSGRSSPRASRCARTPATPAGPDCGIRSRVYAARVGEHSVSGVVAAGRSRSWRSSRFSSPSSSRRPGRPRRSRTRRRSRSPGRRRSSPSSSSRCAGRACGIRPVRRTRAARLFSSPSSGRNGVPERHRVRRVVRPQAHVDRVLPRPLRAAERRRARADDGPVRQR